MSVQSDLAARLVDPATAVSHVEDGETIVVPIEEQPGPAHGDDGRRIP